MAFFGSYSLGTIFSDLINVNCTICNCVGLAGGAGGGKGFSVQVFSNQFIMDHKSLESQIMHQ